MARPIWKGNISFGLVNIPVELYSAENRANELHFHLLDARNKARIKYEKKNEVTGKSVPLDKVVKAFEFEKGNYIQVDEKQLEKTAAENSQTVEIKEFIDQDSLDPMYWDRPYYLTTNKQGEKGYVLLRETLRRSNKVGIAFVVIKTKQHLAALIPHKNMLVLNLLRFSKDLVKPEQFEVPKGDLKSYNISPKEVDMAEKLIDSMTSKWDPQKYQDKNKELLKKWIQQKIKKGKSLTAPEPEKEKEEKRSAQVIDFMSLLKKSLSKKGRRTHSSTKTGKPSKSRSRKTRLSTTTRKPKPKRSPSGKRPPHKKPSKGKR